MLNEPMVLNLINNFNFKAKHNLDNDIYKSYLVLDIDMVDMDYNMVDIFVQGLELELVLGLLIYYMKSK